MKKALKSPALISQARKTALTFIKIVWGLGLSIFLWGFAYSAMSSTTSDELRAKFDECVTARDKGTANSIDDFICPSANVGTQQDIAFQIAVDMAFRRLDREIEWKLQEFQTQKSKDPVVTNNQLVDWFDMTGPKAKDSYPIKYLQVCQDLSNSDNPLAKTVKSLGGATTGGAAGEFVFGGNACIALVDSKMRAYRDMGYLIGLKGATESYKDDKEKFITSLNTEYQNFLMQWTIYIGELSRIKSKWNIKTKTQNS